ncbi:TlpA family protein disulfide reductase [Paludisphaera borealis]|uniref:Thiol-disulfide oxidoreductase ResA n=1 Tax=Paludisphaera borealis TaxID=1387353 RepID=A0A1U7CQ83_9BACT|nr:TlpA disulfide reductase family protein [Paludisphaera borealis]APW61104.1 Thiol-disulfide oxidoreductase ResA [Paludisphaera borealis]
MYSTILALLALLILPGSDEPAAKKTDEVSKQRRDEFHKLTVANFENREKGGGLPWNHFASRHVELAEKNPEDSTGYLSLEALALGDSFSTEPTGDDAIPYFSKAIDLLIRHHVQGGRASDLAQLLASPSHFGSASAQTERFLREVLEKNPSAETRAGAALSLVRFLKGRADLARRLEGDDGGALARRLEATWGRPYLEALKACDPQKLDQEAEGVSRRGLKEHAEYWKRQSLPGRQALEINGEDVAGKPMSLSQFRGKVVVLSFWGFGCLPCRAMFPHEKAMVKRMEGRPFVLLGVDADLDRAKTLERLAKEGITWRSWWDGGEKTVGPIADAWQIRCWPSVFVIDHKGVIRYRDFRGKELELMVDLLVSDAEKDQDAGVPAGRAQSARTP